MGSPTVLLHPSFYQIGIASISLSKREIRFYISKKKKKSSLIMMLGENPITSLHLLQYRSQPGS